MARLSGALAGAILAVAACGARAEPVQPGHEQGLGLLPREIPDELKKAEANPYAMPPEPVCANIDRELAALEGILGPDVDGVQAKENKAKDLVTDAVRGAIPYRSWIRKITGAERREKKRDHDVLAAWERRGYLKGLARQRQCLGPLTGPAEASEGSGTAGTPQPGYAPPAPVAEAGPPADTGVLAPTAEPAEDQGAPADAIAPAPQTEVDAYPLPPAQPADDPDEGDDEAPPPASPEAGR